MKLIDIGINLMNSSYDRDRDEVVKNAALAGISPLVITGSGERSSLDAALYARAHNRIRPGALYSTAGIHPHEAKNCGNNSIGFLRELSADKTEGPSVVRAVGECGLDYNRDFSPRDVQRTWFAKQLELAAQTGKPVFLHERDAFPDFSAILKERLPSLKNAVIHCFTGGEKELEGYLEMGCFIGITGWICDERRGGHLKRLVSKIPSERLMLETDAPFLLPRDLKGPSRGGKSGRNEPRYLVHIAQTLAKSLGKDAETLAAETFANTCRFFEIEI